MDQLKQLISNDSVWRIPFVILFFILSFIAIYFIYEPPLKSGVF